MYSVAKINKFSTHKKKVLFFTPEGKKHLSFIGPTNEY